MNCKDCGTLIPLARLRAIHDATRCLHCQKEYETTVPKSATLRRLERVSGSLVEMGEFTLSEIFS